MVGILGLLPDSRGFADAASDGKPGEVVAFFAVCAFPGLFE